MSPTIEILLADAVRFVPLALHLAHQKGRLAVLPLTMGIGATFDRTHLNLCEESE